MALRYFSQFILKSYGWKFTSTERFYSSGSSNGPKMIAPFLNPKFIGSEVAVQGWIKAIRKHKNLTFMTISDGTEDQIQVVFPADKVNELCCYNSAVSIMGKLCQSPINSCIYEIQGSCVNLVGQMHKLSDFPFAPRKIYPPDYVRKHLHLRPKTKINSSTMRLSSLVTSSLLDTLTKEGFIHIFTPVFTSNDCEGAGEVFTVIGDKKDDKFFLTVSAQFHLEAMAGGLSKVYTLGPTFRAENSQSRRHLTEFRMLEAEMNFCENLDPLLSTMESLIKHAAAKLLEHGMNDIQVLNKYYNHNIQESLTDLVSRPFQVMTYAEVIKLLLENQSRFVTCPQPGHDLGVEHELFIVAHNDNCPTFVVDWPANIKPFYMRTKSEDVNLVSNVDLLVPQVGELCGGSLRENRFNVLQDKLNSLKLAETLNWYLDLRKYGNSPTGGFGLGYERLVAYLLKIPNIKDVVAFPRTPHHCKM